ncbi:MAG: polysaccharide deacetylase family protein [Candidatus Nanohaloarchaea archaeon]
MVECPIFCYHGVSEEPRQWDVKPGDFREQVEWLDSNYSLMPLGEFFTRFHEEDLPEDPAVLTFDDGLKSSYRAADVLEDLGARATFYIITGLMGELWDGAEVMSWSQVKELDDRGHEVGAHTVSHPNLPKYSDSR